MNKDIGMYLRHWIHHFKKINDITTTNDLTDPQKFK